IDEKNIQIYGVEAAGLGVDTDQHAATITRGSIGVIHGMMTYLLHDQYGQIQPVYSISAGLDYPGIGPEHAYFHSTGKAKYVSITDEEAVSAFKYLTKIEGIIPALESAHAIAYLMKLAPKTNPDDIIVLNLSGRGDKDIHTLTNYGGGENE
ncbi:MAG: tryptophan synthase subunit beta, partial [Clostridia bacterium]|nr:tryptophan synthase subunit beta [Clostridia bacterium]